MWGQWTPCTAACGGGYYNRYRYCHKDKQQPYLDQQTELCNTRSCPTPTSMTMLTTVTSSASTSPSLSKTQVTMATSEITSTTETTTTLETPGN